MKETVELLIKIVLAGLNIWYIVWIIVSIKEIKNNLLPDIKKDLAKINPKTEKIEVQTLELRAKMNELERKIENISKRTPE